MEKCILHQLIDRFNSSNLLPDFHSVYSSDYSTAISLITITNNILWAVENQRAMIMILLDLSPAFDMVDHNILINILKEHYHFCKIRLCIVSPILKTMQLQGLPQWTILKLKTIGLYDTKRLLFQCQYLHLLLHPHQKHYSTGQHDQCLCH